MVFVKNALICTKKVKLINHDCLPILMLLYIMLCIVLAYLMLFASIMLLLLPLISAIGLLTHSLFISCINLYHAQFF